MRQRTDQIGSARRLRIAIDLSFLTGKMIKINHMGALKSKQCPHMESAFLARVLQ
jgi:hypothetical protein